MASYNELLALIDAYINQNGVQAITGQVLNGVLRAMVDQLGRGYSIMGAADPTTDPGTPDGPETWFASVPGTYTNFDGIQIVDGELALLSYVPSTGFSKNTIYEGFQTVQATIDGNVGTPAVGVSYANGILSFDFHNMKGVTGDPAGFGAVTASVDSNIGTPSVQVQTSGPDTAKAIAFQFHNLKGETGVTSVLATVDNTSGNPQCAVSLNGQQLVLNFTGLKGAQGDTGSSVDYPFTIVNNLTTNDATQALSAAQGVVLDGKVSQLEAKVNEFIPIDVDGKLVLYSGGGVASVGSGYYIKEIAVTPGDVLIVKTSYTFSNAAVVAMYKGNTYSQSDSIQATSIGNNLNDVKLVVPADVTKVIVGYQGNAPTSAYVKYYSNKWVDYISGEIKDTSYTKVFPELESGYYNATVGSVISKASHSTFGRTPLIDIEGLTTVRVSFDNGKLNPAESMTLTTPGVILTDKNSIVLYANNIFLNNSEIDLSLYPTVKYLALVIMPQYMSEVAYEYNEVEKLGILSSDYAAEISALNESTSQLEGEVSAINKRTFNSPFRFSRNYVLYATGELAAGADGFKYEEITVQEGDFVRVFTKITPTTAAIIAAYNGDTYVKAASILTNGQAKITDYVVPAGVNKLRVSAQYDLGTEQYYVNTIRYALYSDAVLTKLDNGYYGNFPKYQDFVVGRQSILYLNNIGRKYEDTINEFYTIQSGYPPTGYLGSPLAISYTPTATGSTDVTFVKKRNISDTLAEKKITFRAVSKNTGNGATKNIIFIGDSLIASGDASEQVYNMLVEDADYAINMLGDNETGSKVNAGHGSWSWADWINPAGESTPIYGVTNPFMHNGELDFANFMSVNYPSLSGIDIAVISLGTNDMGQGAGGIDNAQAAVANAKVFIDALLADYPNVKIAIGIPSCGAYSAGATGFAHYPQGFRNSILLYAKEMIDTFDNGAYHANVTCVFHGWFIDLDNDYPNTELTLPSGVKTKCVTNFIHPSAVGYRHWGVGYYNKIRAFLAGQL